MKDHHAIKNSHFPSRIVAVNVTTRFVEKEQVQDKVVFIKTLKSLSEIRIFFSQYAIQCGPSNKILTYKTLTKPIKYQRNFFCKIILWKRPYSLPNNCQIIVQLIIFLFKIINSDKN